jgi:hypothetical protein
VAAILARRGTAPPWLDGRPVLLEAPVLEMTVLEMTVLEMTVLLEMPVTRGLPALAQKSPIVAAACVARPAMTPATALVTAATPEAAGTPGPVVDPIASATPAEALETGAPPSAAACLPAGWGQGPGLA